MRLDGLTVAAAGDGFTASVTVTNTGMRPGRHVVQLYATQAGNPVADTGVLVGFSTVELAARATSVVTVVCSLRPLQRWDGRRLTTPAGEIIVTARSFAGDPEALTATLSN